MTSKSEMLTELKTMLRDVFTARAAGTATPRLARTHGYIDGYMRAMMECGQAEQSELLALVAEQRAIVYGPSTSVTPRSEPISTTQPVAGATTATTDVLTSEPAAESAKQPSVVAA